MSSVFVSKWLEKQLPAAGTWFDAEFMRVEQIPLADMTEFSVDSDKASLRPRARVMIKRSSLPASARARRAARRCASNVVGRSSGLEKLPPCPARKAV